MSIQQLHLKNFQCHKNFEISFDSHITTIIAKNDTGKSAIIRAIEFVVFNDGSDKEIINWDADYVKVKMKVDDHWIVRKKGKKGNTYSFDDKEYRAFGQKVPEDIAKFLNVSEVNFSKQHSLPFWFSETSGQVSKELNSIVNLSIIDNSLTYVSSHLKKTKSELEFSEERLSELKEKKKKIEWVVEAEKDLQEIESFQKEIKEKESKTNGLSESIIKIREFREIKNQFKEIRESLEGAMESIQIVLEKQKIMESFSELLEELKNDKRAIVDLKKEIKSIDKQLDSIKSCPVCDRPMEKKL